MITVIFEVWSAAGRQEKYLDLATALRPALDGLDGFVSVERYRSLIDPDKLVSLSFFRDEEAVHRWRNLQSHRATQMLGRKEIFRDYRLRVADVEQDRCLARCSDDLAKNMDLNDEVFS